MFLWKYPSDSEILELDLRQIYLGNYVNNPTIILNDDRKIITLKSQIKNLKEHIEKDLI